MPAKYYRQRLGGECARSCCTQAYLLSVIEHNYGLRNAIPDNRRDNESHPGGAGAQQGRAATARPRASPAGRGETTTSQPRPRRRPAAMTQQVRRKPEGRTSASRQPMTPSPSHSSGSAWSAAAPGATTSGDPRRGDRYDHRAWRHLSIVWLKPRTTVWPLLAHMASWAMTQTSPPLRANAFPQMGVNTFKPPPSQMVKPLPQRHGWPYHLPTTTALRTMPTGTRASVVSKHYGRTTATERWWWSSSARDRRPREPKGRDHLQTSPTSGCRLAAASGPRRRGATTLAKSSADRSISANSSPPPPGGGHFRPPKSLPSGTTPTVRLPAGQATSPIRSWLRDSTSYDLPAARLCGRQGNIPGERLVPTGFRTCRSDVRIGTASVHHRVLHGDDEFAVPQAPAASPPTG